MERLGLNTDGGSTYNLFKREMKAIETRAIERSKRRRAQELLPFPPEAKAEPAIPEQTAQLIEFGVVSRNPRFFRHGYLSGL